MADLIGHENFLYKTNIVFYPTGTVQEMVIQTMIDNLKFFNIKTPKISIKFKMIIKQEIKNVSQKNLKSYSKRIWL
jgi:hypothetical protein